MQKWLVSAWLQERKFFVHSAINDSIVTFNGENFFDVKAIANVTMLIAPEEFSCELDIPEANYTARKEAIYYPGECYSSPDSKYTGSPSVFFGSINRDRWSHIPLMYFA